MNRPDVRALFDRIAPVYDAMNERISYGRQRAWKKRLALDAQDSGGEALDICCGTGDIALLLAERGAFSSVAGLDFSEGMLSVARARTKDDAVRWILADAGEGLPFENERFDTLTLSFGLRNLLSPDKALCELHRVLKRGGRLYVLDAARPSGVLTGLVYRIQYRLFFPILTRKDRADYDWLRRSSEGFWNAGELRQHANKAGFTPVKARRYAFGLALYQVLERRET